MVEESKEVKQPILPGVSDELISPPQQNTEPPVSKKTQTSNKPIDNVRAWEKELLERTSNEQLEQGELEAPPRRKGGFGGKKKQSKKIEDY